MKKGPQDTGHAESPNSSFEESPQPSGSNTWRASDFPPLRVREGQGTHAGVEAAISQPPASVPEAQGERPKEPAVPQILPSASKKEKFLLMAADQEAGSRDERLNRVIQAKYEAGLLKPYDYVKGYARLSRWMDRK